MLPLWFILGMFPARAGMSRASRTLTSKFPDVPRASGDEPHRGAGPGVAQLCSPRERG